MPCSSLYKNGHPITFICFTFFKEINFFPFSSDGGIMVLYIVNSGVMSSLFDESGSVLFGTDTLTSDIFPLYMSYPFFGCGIGGKIEGNKNSGDAPFLFKMAAAAFTASIGHEYSYIYAERKNRCTYDRICFSIYHHCLSPVLF